MIKIAVYGKGGIGKSTTVSNMSLALAEKGLKVMQIGCDPKADSTTLLRGGKRCKTVLELMREKGDSYTLEDMVSTGAGGVICVEAGGPIPGLGCAGRGIIVALEKLESKGAFEKYKPDVVFYDVLGDVVCGGFSMPMRKGYADKIFVVTSGEKMALYAAANISMAVENFKARGYASLGGYILNSRSTPNEVVACQAVADDFNTKIVGRLSQSETVRMADAENLTVMQAFPKSEMADEYRTLTHNIMKIMEMHNA